GSQSHLHLRTEQGPYIERAGRTILTDTEVEQHRMEMEVRIGNFPSDSSRCLMPEDGRHESRLFNSRPPLSAARHAAELLDDTKDFSECPFGSRFDLFALSEGSMAPDNRRGLGQR